MIEVENLTKRYGRHTAVDGISFRVEKGEILGFLGPNGAGKTTTMRILTCYLDRKPHQEVRPSHCRGRDLLPRGEGRDPRLPGAQRGREDNDDAHPHLLP